MNFLKKHVQFRKAKFFLCLHRFTICQLPSEEILNRANSCLECFVLIDRLLNCYSIIWWTQQPSFIYLQTNYLFVSLLHLFAGWHLLEFQGLCDCCLCLNIFSYMKYNPSKLKKYTKSKNSEKLQNAVNLPLWIFRPKILGICFHEAMA